MITLDDEQALRRAVEAIRDRLVADFDPQEIWLYGSAARGDIHRHSDLDLLVVADFNGASTKEMALKMRRAAKDAARVPLDVVPVRPEVYQTEVEVFGSFAHLATQDGKKIYVREDEGGAVV